MLYCGLCTFKHILCSVMNIMVLCSLTQLGALGISMTVQICATLRLRPFLPRSDSDELSSLEMNSRLLKLSLPVARSLSFSWPADFLFFLSSLFPPFLFLSLFEGERKQNKKTFLTDLLMHRFHYTHPSNVMRVSGWLLKLKCNLGLTSVSLSNGQPTVW